MRIISGDCPDIWYETGDLTTGSLVIIRRESITCCGFLGGDTLQVIKTGTLFADLLDQYRPVFPFHERGKIGTDKISEIQERKKKILITLRSFNDSGEEEQVQDISKWYEILSLITHTLWFTGSQDPFRYELELSGNIQDFLRGAIYPHRLITCLHWWYASEATSEEQEQYPMIPVITELLYPDHQDLIIRAVNLYNHGTYEIARERESANIFSFHYGRREKS